MTTQQIQAKRQQLLNQLAPLDQLRRGSLIDQLVTVKRKDGSQIRRGPYPLFTSKRQGKTVSRRLTNPTHASLYRQQIQAMRQFEQIIAQLISLGEALSERALQEATAPKKTTPLP